MMFEFEQKRVDLQVFIESSILINRVGIKKVLRIKVRCIKGVEEVLIATKLRCIKVGVEQVSRKQ